jgi:hypothetical protein
MSDSDVPHLLDACCCTGEMVLLLHWSLLNYAAVVKILKKHGKGVAQQGTQPACCMTMAAAACCACPGPPLLHMRAMSAGCADWDAFGVLQTSAQVGCCAPPTWPTSYSR